MTISKFYHDTESNSVIDLSLITNIDSIEFKESYTSTQLKRTFWQWLRGKKHEKHEYKYVGKYRVHLRPDITRIVTWETSTDLPLTDQEKSKRRKCAKEHQEKLIKALQEYDISSRTLNSQNNSNNEGVITND